MVGARRLTAMVVGCWLVLAMGSAVAAAPSGRISSMDISGNRVQFLFTAQGLPPDTPLDHDSVKVTAGGRSLVAQAEPPGAARPGEETSKSTRAVMLVLDTSGSMSAGDLKAAKRGAVSFLGLLPADIPAGFTTTGTSNRPVMAPTTDRDAVGKAIAKLRPGGETALHDGLATALDRLAGTAEGRIVVLSDGKDSTSKVTLPQVLSRLTAKGVAADVVAFKTAATSEGTLQRLTSATGGRLLASPDAQRLNDAFADAAATFRQSMWITVTLPEALEREAFRLEVVVSAGGDQVTATASVSEVSAPVRTVEPAAAPAPAQTPIAADIPLPAVLGVCFVAVLMLIVAAGGIGRDSRPEWAVRIDRYRLRARSAALGGTVGPEVRNPVLRGALDLSKRSLSGDLEQRLARDLDRAGILLRPHEWTLLRIAIGFGVATLLSLALGNLLLGPPAAALVTWIATRVYLRGRADRRLTAFGDQLPDALQLVAGSLRSGFSVTQSVERLAQLEMQPIGSEMARAVARTRLGITTEDALRSVADRMNCRDLHWVVLAIQIQREVGGNLAEVIETTVETMRERTRLRRQIRALSAEGRLSAYVLLALPIVTGAVLMVLRPTYMAPLHTTGMGYVLIGIVAVLMTVGWLWLRQTIKVEA